MTLSGDDMAINTFSYAPGTGISSTGSHTLRGSGTFFVCSEPTKQFYFTAYTSPLFPSTPHSPFTPRVAHATSSL
jgi:hypothetical protein